MESLEAPI